MQLKLDYALKQFFDFHAIIPIYAEFQYFVYPPLAFNTAATLCGMLSISSLHFSWEVLYHTFPALSQSSFTLVGVLW